MRKMFEVLHAKLGDFWWYTAMLFCAQRAADVINLFVGLWLVPKFVGVGELGAVLPLTSFATFLALPAYIFAMTFMKEVNTLATHKQYGQLKSLMRGVFIAVGVFLVLAIVVARFVLPMFLERMRIANGSLGFLILASAFVGCVAPIYSNAVNALKKFKEISIINLICSPLRLITMMVTMPFRALSGYFVGQAASPSFTIVASVFCLRKELAIKAERYWTRPIIKRLFGIFMMMACYQGFGMVNALVQQTVLRQRLPDLDSAAYYMLSRFSDITNMLSSTLIVTLFPFTAELAESGKPTRAFVVKSSLLLAGFSALLALPFAMFGEDILRLLPDGKDYAAYARYLPALIGITAISGITVFHTNTEASACRWRFLLWLVPIHLVSAGALLFVTGYGYFARSLPAEIGEFVGKINVTSLESMLWWLAVPAIAQLICSVIQLSRQRGVTSP